MEERKYIIDKEVAEKKLLRMAYEIAERNPGIPDICLAGIKQNGAVIAVKIANLLKELFNLNVQILEISIDKKHPDEVTINPAHDLNNKVIIIIDDVANTGRTMFYALKPFMQQHPDKIQTLVLVERTHKTFPISSDYVGLSVSTTLQEHIVVEVSNNEITGAYLI